MTSSEPVLAVRDVSVVFGGVHAVSNVDLTVGVGERVGVIGPNGAGKTSLLNAVSGVVGRTGSMTFDGRCLDGMPPYRLAALGVARTFQLAEHFHDFTLVDYVMLGDLARHRPSLFGSLLATRRTVRADRELRDRASSTLEEFGLRQWAGTVLREMPYGIQKIADICRALLSRPTLLLLDEPTSGTAASERRLIAATFEVIRARGIATVLVDHDSEFVASVVDRLILMDQGRVVAEGPPREVLAGEQARAAYLGGKVLSLGGDSDREVDR
ncbi:ABC transporter ATP-binding protein [Dactylosporangium sp. CA-092794]|uniref:ABC transporter ATP-binding protein n=1 Tax=Dactylosporangium sp. CA-092794 TaxID=3239929 RepID=UPI003D8FFE1B